MKYKTKLVLYIIAMGVCVIGLIFSINWFYQASINPCYAIPQCTVVTHTYTGTTITKWVNP